MRELIILLAVSLPITFVFHKIKLPPLVGFLITGILIGPHGSALITETRVVERLSEIGVVLLLFTVGLEFSIEDIIRLGKQFLIGGGLQVGLTIFATAAASLLFPFPFYQAVFFGFLASLSSTAIVLKMYSDRAELDTSHGRLATGILLFQDMAVVPLMLLLPVLGEAQSAGGITLLSILKSLGKAFLGLLAVFLAARQFVPFLLHQVVRLRNREMFFLLVVLLCLGTAWVTYSLGLSLALGAFLAGLIIAESEYSHHIVADILPFRDYFASIFFISIGMLLHTSYFTGHWPLILLLAASVVILKSMVVAVSALLLRYPLRSALLASLALSQVGEFSFLLAQQGGMHRLIEGATFQAFINTSILTMLATPFLIQVAPWVAAQFHIRASEAGEQPSVCALTGHTIIAGYGLNGRNLARTLRVIRIPYVVLEVNADTIRKARDEGEPMIYGDITREDVLIRAGAPCARVIVFAVSDFAATRMAIRHVRNINTSIFILVRTRYAADIDTLLGLGADQVIAEEFETSIEIFSRVLHQYHIPANIINNQVTTIRFDGYKMLRGLSLDQEKITRLAALFAAATVEHVQLLDEHFAADKTLRELDLRHATGASVIAMVREGAAVTNPTPDTILRQDDILVLLGSHRELDESVEYLTKGRSTE